MGDDETQQTTARGRGGGRGFRYAPGEGGEPEAPVDIVEPDDEGDDEQWESWAEPEVAPTRDLFSLKMFATAADCLAYANSEHGLDLATIAASLRLDIYGRVKLVNYVRARAAAENEPKAIVQAVVKAASGDRAGWPWLGDEYLMPVVEEDPLLYSLGAPVPKDGGAAEGALAEADGEDVDMEDDDARGGSGAGGAGGTADETALLLQTIGQMRADMVEMLGLNDADDTPPTEGAPAADATPDLGTDLAGELRRAKEALAQRDAQVAALTQQVAQLTTELAEARQGKAK